MRATRLKKPIAWKIHICTIHIANSAGLQTRIAAKSITNCLFMRLYTLFQFLVAKNFVLAKDTKPKTGKAVINPRQMSVFSRPQSRIISAIKRYSGIGSSGSRPMDDPKRPMSNLAVLRVGLHAPDVSRITEESPSKYAL